MGRNTTKEEIIAFLIQFNEEKGTTPRQKDWKVKDGFPCNKEKLLRLFGTYNEALRQANLRTYKYGERRYVGEELIHLLREAIIQSKTTNFSAIRKKHGLPNFSVYQKEFGSYEAAVSETGISTRNLYLMNHYPDYDMEDPSYFIKEKIMGKGNEFSEEHLELIEKARKHVSEGVSPTRDILGPKVSIQKTLRLFGNHSNLLIAAGIDPYLPIKRRRLNKAGMICDSLGEVIVSNWMIDKGIPFEMHTDYPKSSYLSDFLIEGRTYVEYTAFQFIEDATLRGRYLERIKEKKRIAEEHGCGFISIPNTTEKDKQAFIEALAGNGHRISL